MSPTPTTAGTTSSSPTPSGRRTVLTDSSYEFGLRTVADGKAKADLAILGTVTGQKTAVDPDEPIPITYSTLKVTRTLWVSASTTAPASELVVVQTNGPIGDVYYEDREDPTFKVGSTWVLFLTKSRTTGYNLTGGPSGRLVVTSGRLSRFNQVGLNFNGNVDDLVNQLAR